MTGGSPGRLTQAGSLSQGSFRWQRNAVLHTTAGASDDGSLRERVKRPCVDHGLRISKARCLILGAIWKTEGHPTAEEIFAELRVDDPRINISSVYRNLRAFEKVGIVTRLEWEGSPARYEEATGRRHEHLVDVGSGSILEFQSPEIEELLARQAKKLGYRLVAYRLTLFGASPGKGWGRACQAAALSALQPFTPRAIQVIVIRISHNVYYDKYDHKAESHWAMRVSSLSSDPDSVDCADFNAGCAISTPAIGRSGARAGNIL
jgi:Fur family ferric uptake transcriptional regulator